MSETNKELVRRHFEKIFNERDFAVCDEIVAEEFVEHGVAPFAQSEPGRVNGPQTMRGTAPAWLRGQFPDLHFTSNQIKRGGEDALETA